jgi:uncharacterized DUF497 family protein
MYEWDEAKRRENLRKHDVDFAIVEAFDWLQSIADEDDTAEGEPRFIAIGPIGAKLYVLVWTPRGDDIVRVISLRKATRTERKRHEEEF